MVLPAYLARAGLGSKLSTWLTPPHMNSQMTLFAFGVKWARPSGGAGFDAGGLKVAEDLGHVFVGDGPDRLQFDDEAVFHEQVGEVLPQHGSVLVVDHQGVLGENLEAPLWEAMHEGVFVHLFEVPVA